MNSDGNINQNGNNVNNKNSVRPALSQYREVNSYVGTPVDEIKEPISFPYMEK